MLKSIMLLLLFTTTLYSQVPDSLSYFPHAVGDVWEYYDYWSYPQPDTVRAWTIFDSSDLGNNFVIMRDSTFDGNVISNYYLIDSAQNVFRCNQNFISNYYGPELKLNANQGHIWVYDKIGPTEFIVGRIDSVYIDNWYGKVDTVKFMSYFLSEDSTLSGNWTIIFQFLYMRGIGLVWHWGDGAGVGRVLKGAMINGQLYGSLTAIHDIIQRNLHPQSFFLYQNYPNPFNPTTIIKYELAYAGRTRLRVYNTIGQKVAELVDEYRPAGTYEVVWNGTDSEGIAVASGIYLCILEIGNKRISKKMTLIK